MDFAQQHHQLLPKLRRTLSKIANQLHHIFPPDFVLETSLKTTESALRKCKDKEFHNLAELSDLIRGRLFFPRPFTYRQVLNTIIKNFRDQVIKIDWKKNYDHGLSYHGILHVDLKVDGIKFELQIMPLIFKPWVEPQHKIYELLRDEPKMDEKKRQQLLEMHNKIFDFLEDQIQDLM